MPSPLSSAVRPRVTMLDVARHAGVSKASVSRFIGDDKALLSDAIALRIEKAIDTLGYRPNQMARGLKRGRTRLIGMLVADIRNPYSIAVMHGVETACRRHGYSLVVCNTDRDPAQESLQLAALQSYNVEGLIINTLGRDVQELRELQRELPMVLVDRKVEQLPGDLVGLDNLDAVRQALVHLRERGYSTLAMVSEPADMTSSRIERIEGFRRLAPGAPVLELGEHFATHLGEFLGAEGNGPKALFCANGVAALACTLALRAHSPTALEQIGLIALDDLDWYPLVANGITALAQPTAAIGVQAFECLFERLHGSDAPVQTFDFPARLIVRGSTPSRRKD